MCKLARFVIRSAGRSRIRIPQSILARVPLGQQLPGTNELLLLSEGEPAAIALSQAPRVCVERTRGLLGRPLIYRKLLITKGYKRGDEPGFKKNLRVYVNAFTCRAYTDERSQFFLSPSPELMYNSQTEYISCTHERLLSRPSYWAQTGFWGPSVSPVVGSGIKGGRQLDIVAHDMGMRREMNHATSAAQTSPTDVLEDEQKKLSSDTKRINLNLSTKSYQDLQHLADTTGRTMTDIVRFGLAVAKLYLEETRKGKKFVIAKNGKAETEIKFPDWGG